MKTSTLTRGLEDTPFVRRDGLWRNSGRYRRTGVWPISLESRLRPARRSRLWWIARAAPNAGAVCASGRGITCGGWIHFPADRVHKVVVEALVPGAMQIGFGEVEDAGDAEYPAAYSFRCVGARDRLEGRIGFHPDPEVPVDPEPLSPLMVQLHYVLWARLLAESAGDPPADVRVTLAQLCEDLGYARLSNGSHRPETKRRIALALRRLAALQLHAEYRTPDGRIVELEGPIWRLRIEGEPLAAVYAPGDWFERAAWRAFNGSVGLVPAALLRLRPDRDAWAIRTGAYLAVLARMNGYRPLTLRVSTLLQKTGLQFAERRNPARMREKLERALERLEEIGLVEQWDWLSVGGREPDMDNAADLSGLVAGRSGPDPERVQIRWAAELGRRERLLTAARDRHRRSRSPRETRGAVR